MITPTRSLYVHVPFCAHRCGYCDFVTTSRSPELHGRYVAALQRELALQGGAPEGGFDTIFVGGGTPTLLEPEAMGELLAWLASVQAPGAELTLECNPETVDERLADQLAAAGARVSLGAQSFSAHVLEALERRANPETVRGAVRQLRAAGIERLSLDLIWAVPGQTDEDLARDLEAALELEPDHLSAYELELKPGTRLAHRFGTDAATALGEAADEHYDFVIDRLQEAGWWWYETANFARDEQERCRHNLAYWHADTWLAVGVGAVGARAHADGSRVRRANLPNVPRWLKAVEAGELPPARIEEIDQRTARLERVMLALRLDQAVRIEASDIADGIVDGAGLERVMELELGTALPVGDADGTLRGTVELRLNRRGRMLQGTVGGLLLDP
ncbi:MAG: coproporphyrinogen oxidase [Thermoleophilia bacterium]|nr:coproporphyrinogen oxidase [Thermoleophilia bacterium]MCZ4497159.1 coproporphyrinogen oxidase [Thermoleophilia bacterium]